MADSALKDKAVFPDRDVLRKTMSNSYAAYVALTEKLAEMEIAPEWRYYRDGGTWLCKMPFGKKNLGWLVVYDGYFEVTCHFMERYWELIAALDIDPGIKAEFDRRAEQAGKLIPMTVSVRSGELPADLITMLELKKGLK